MTQVSKNILRNSINVFLSSTNEDKERYIKVVEKNLNDHKNAMNSIGMGYCLHTVNAGEIFLRIFNK
jgi:hypothetical protein